MFNLPLRYRNRMRGGKKAPGSLYATPFSSRSCTDCKLFGDYELVITDKSVIRNTSVCHTTGTGKRHITFFLILCINLIYFKINTKD